MKQRQYIDFLNKIEKLKCNTRHSWTSSGRQESVAEHSWRLAVMAMLQLDRTLSYAETDLHRVTYDTLRCCRKATQHNKCRQYNEASCHFMSAHPAHSGLGIRF